MNLDDILSPPSLMLGPQGPGGTLAQQGRPKPKPQRPMQTPMTAKKAPVDLSDNPFADTSGNPFADAAPETPTAPDTSAKWHRAYQTGRLQANNADLAEGEAVGPAQYAEAASQAPETFAAGIPGVALGISAQRAMLQHRPLADVQREVNAETSDVPYFSKAAKMLGAGAITPALPASGLVSGAILGGAEGVLNNDPNSGLGNRAFQGVVGAGIGGAAGGLLDRVLTGARARPRWLGGPKNASTQVQDLQDIRAGADRSNYGSAEDQGKRYYVDLGDAQDAAMSQNKANSNLLERHRVVAANENVQRAETNDALRAADEAKKAADAAAIAHGESINTAPAPRPTLREGLDNFRDRSAAAATRSEGTTAQQSAREALERHAAEASVPPLTRGPGTGVVPDVGPIGQIPMVKVPQNVHDIGRSVVDIPRSPLTGALNSQTVAPYANIVRNSERFQGADDATILRETYKLMSEAQAKRLAVGERGEFAAASDFQLKDLGAAKDRLRQAADRVMPDFNHAVDTHRILSGELTANKQGYGAGQKILAGPSTAGQIGKPPKAGGGVPDVGVFERRNIPKMTLPEARQATQGLLGSIQESGQGYDKNPLHAFGIKTGTRTQALINALDKRTGQRLPQQVQKAILAALTGYTQ